ncbi:MAG TPA: YcaO-like family protein [Jatrophihabitans sp.]|nr:YcaO-like family protein [Jatrophihabitans sp.]
MTAVAESVVRTGPGAPDWPWARWLRASGPMLIGVRGGFDTAWERASVAEARRLGLPLLSIRVYGREVQIGPLSPADAPADAPADGSADAAGGCAGCAWLRERWTWSGAREAAVIPTASGPAPGGEYPAVLSAVVEACAGTLAVAPLAPGELVTVSDRGVIRRHRVRRSFHCQVCRPAAPAGKPGPLRLSPRPTSARLPVRAAPGPFGLDVDRMRAALTDRRFGPATKVLRDRAMPYALTEISMVGGTPPGYGRAGTFREAEMIGYFEALERYAGYPHVAPLVRGVSYRGLAEPALDPASLGHYAPEQYSFGLSKMRPFDQDTPMDWTWALPLRGSEPVLVPADVAFYQYQYPVADTGDGRPEARNYFLESSNGCAIGSTLEEAALHSLLELTERDAFQIAWHRARPLPWLDPDDIADPESRLLMHQIRQAGYDVHLLVATADIPIPVVWALVIHRDRILPASFSAAGSGPDPDVAIRSALWEVSQLAIAGLNWDPAEHVASIADPWRVGSLVDHIRRNAFPELLPRIEAVLGGPKVTRAEAFPGWPERLVEAAGGDVTGALRTVADLFAGAGLDTVLVVDQSTPEHRELGLHAARCIVPGIVSLTFGHAHQRLLGLPRLLGDLPVPDCFGFDPHPFP